MAMDPAESFLNAKRFARGAGPIPASFSTTVRSLHLDHASGDPSLSEMSAYQVKRVLSGPTALSCLYYAADCIYPEKLTATTSQLKCLDLARLFDPDTLAAILIVTYMAKRLQKLCPEEDWALTSELFYRNIDICAKLGVAYPTVGPCAALLGAAMPYIGFGMFLGHDRKGFAEYRRYLKMRKLFSDPEAEQKRWGCTSVEVGAAVMIDSGFDSQITKAFSEGFGSGDTKQQDVWRFRVVRFWLEFLGRDGNLKELELGGLSQDVRETLKSLASLLKELRDDDSRTAWPARGRDDISEELTPLLDLSDVVLPEPKAPKKDPAAEVPA